MIKYFLSMICLTVSLVTSAEGKKVMKLTSPGGFYHNAMMPPKFTCDGQQISPPLQWEGAPAETKSFVLICEDPDIPSGGIWDHWLLYNIPADTKNLPEAAADLPQGTKQGLNSWNKIGYGAPCPPDREHRYMFRIYALDRMLTFDNPPTKEQLKQKMEGHILMEATLIGRYHRLQNR
jgi:Raf kinase inhibitor-like YbhB/YbcL family protein